MQQAGEESKCKMIDAESVDWSSGASIPEETSENIGKNHGQGTTTATLQRSKTRNKAFCKMVVDTRLRRPRLLYESDNIVVVYDSTDKEVFRWFVRWQIMN